MSDDEILTAREVAFLLRISVDQVYRLPLPKHRLGRRAVRYSRAEVLQFVLSQPDTLRPAA